MAFKLSNFPYKYLVLLLLLGLVVATEPLRWWMGASAPLKKTLRHAF
jgi:hypothetical protein